jgi:hypothetical protein
MYFNFVLEDVDMLWGKFRPHKQPKPECKILYSSAPDVVSQSSRDVNNFDMNDHIAKQMRLQSISVPDRNTPFIFFGRRHEPDPDLLDIAAINLFTEIQWKLWEQTDKRALLLQCGCVVEHVIEDPIHESAACYEYRVSSLNQFAEELRSVIKVHLGLHDE